MKKKIMAGLMVVGLMAGLFVTPAHAGSKTVASTADLTVGAVSMEAGESIVLTATVEGKISVGMSNCGVVNAKVSGNKASISAEENGTTTLTFKSTLSNGKVVTNKVKVVVSDKAGVSKVATKAYKSGAYNVRINPSRLTMKAGQRASVNVSNNKDVTVKYMSSNAKVLTVNAKTGVMQAKKGGTATVTSVVTYKKSGITRKVTTKVSVAAVAAAPQVQEPSETVNADKIDNAVVGILGTTYVPVSTPSYAESVKPETGIQGSESTPVEVTPAPQPEQPEVSAPAQPEVPTPVATEQFYIGGTNASTVTVTIGGSSFEAEVHYDGGIPYVDVPQGSQDVTIS